MQQRPDFPKGSKNVRGKVGYRPGWVPLLPSIKIRASKGNSETCNKILGWFGKNRANKVSRQRYDKSYKQNSSS